MRRFIALFLVISFLGMNCATYERGEGLSLEPGQKPGAKLVIQKKDGQQLRGELITVKQNSLLLKESESGVDVSSDIWDIETVIIEKKSKALLGVGVGFALGAATGTLIGYSMGDTDGASTSLGAGMLTQLLGSAEFKAICTGLVGGILGAIIGGIIGSRSGTDERIQIEGKSDSEIKKILEDLRKKARVPNFQ